MSTKLGILAAIAIALSGTSWAGETEIEVETEGADGASIEVEAEGTGGAGVNIDIAPEQRTQIKQYVVKEKVSPITVREEISVDSTLPSDVKLIEVPSDWGPSVSSYRYVYSSDKVFLVEPSSRKVVYVIE